ncbi:MAG: UDP-N-acetylglucosamine--LPS N-acetylglucosamine transferase [Qingshengfaniella sp.]
MTEDTTTMAGATQPKRILAIASGGGHWQQLMLMRPAFEGHEVRFMTTLPGLPEQFGAQPATIVPDCNRDKKRAMIRTSAVILCQMAAYRPHVVISTGALPGVIALTLGRAMGARTIWVDSVANAEEMSLSGRMARHVAHLWMSQWQHVADAAGADYAGAVL